MSNTYSLIASNVLTSGQTIVTFSGIPQTYTDLVFRLSLRTNNTFDDALYNIRINGSSSTLYSQTRLTGTGADVTAVRHSNSSSLFGMYPNTNAQTASTFSNEELYIPNYTASQNKPMSMSIVSENNNATFAYVMAHAMLFRSTSAITEVSFDSITTTVFNSGSSFFLYGIKNS